MAKDSVSLQKEVISEMIGIGATKAIGKLASNLLAAVTKGHLEKHGNRLSSMLVGMPEEIEKIFIISVAYALEQGTRGPLDERSKWINQAQHDAYWTRLAELPREKNNLYRLIIVQDWIQDWLKDEKKDFNKVIYLTAQAIAADAKMSEDAWQCKTAVLDLDQPVLPFSLRDRIKELEEKKRALKQNEETFWRSVKKPAYITAGFVAVLIIVFIVVAVVRS